MTATTRLSAPEVDGHGGERFAVQVDGLSKSFGGTQALSDVTFRIPAGQVTGVIGPNGSGKTTLLKCLSGFLRPTAGTISIFGEPVAGASPQSLFQRGVVQTFQRVALAEDMTVAENIIIGVDGRRLQHPRRLVADLLGHDPGLHGVPVQPVIEALGRTRLEGYADELVGNLPLGIRRRVELARAVAAGPRLLLLDEPTSGLDARESAEMVDVVRDVSAGRGVTTVIVEHDLQVLQEIATHLVVLDFGQVIGQGDVESTLADERVRTAYLGPGDG